MKLNFYCLKNCDTCRKSLKELEAAGFDVTVTDIRKDGVPAAVLTEALGRLGQAVLLTTRSPTWKTLSAAEQQSDPVQLMLQHPTLMKRPLIMNDDWISAGWAKETRSALAALAEAS